MPYLQLLGVVIGLFLANLAWAAAPSPGPLLYDEAADARCAMARGVTIQPAWVKELRDRLPEIQQLWQTLAPAMFAAANTLTLGKVAVSGDAIELTLCDLPSGSLDGPRVNMRYALSAFTANPVPLRVKIDTAFHESLHGALARLAPSASPLLTVHGSESSCVRHHLHLLALQKAVLLSLGDDAALAQLIEADAQLPSPCYRRAWGLINATPDRYRAFVDELAGN